MKSRNLFLGIVFVAVGVLALLSSLDIIDFSWRIACKLWPLLLVFIGIVVLPVKDRLKAVLLLVALAVGVLLYSYEVNQRNDHWYYRIFSQSIDKQKVEMPVA